jgi:hypothetical protein
MNQFLIATKSFIDTNGISCSYIAVQEGSYNVETGSTTNTETTYIVKMYKKHLKATQYNYPNLVGKDAAMFYLTNNSLAFTPAVRDKITFSGTTYTIDSIQEHSALGAVLLYRIIAVKG